MGRKKPTPVPVALTTLRAARLYEPRLVTGASRGIGAAIALELAQKGLKVIGTATTEEGASKISQTLSAFIFKMPHS